MSTELPELLCRVNFPLYQATMITPRHLLVAGGGGAANTGVFNGIVSLKFLSFLRAGSNFSCLHLTELLFFEKGFMEKIR